MLDTLLEDALVAHVAPVLLLLSARVLPLAWLLPRAASAPASWWSSSVVGLALGLTLLPLALSTPHEALALGATLLAPLLSELLRGVMFAFAVCLPLHAFSWTGQLADRVRGALGDQGAAPETVFEAPLSTLYHYGALAVLVASGAHLLVVDAFAEGLQRFPLGSVPDVSSAASVAHASVDLVTRALSLALELSAPVLLSLLALSLVLGLLARVSASLVAPLLQGPLVPMAGVGIVCVLAALTLPEAETALRVFLQQASSVLRALG